MCLGGGGGGGAPAPVDPFQEAQAQILIMQHQAKIDAEAELRRLEQEATQKEADRELFLSSLDTQTADALIRGRSTIEGQELDLDRFLPLLQQEIDLTSRSVPFLDPNPAAFFGGDIAQQVLDRERDKDRRGFTNDLLGFAGPNFATELFPNTSDDAILQALLQEQFQPASDQILRAFQRGNLTDVGFRAANSQLTGQNTAANARLQDLGGGVLVEGRNALTDIANTGFNRASTFELGQSFDPGSIESAITTSADDFRGGLEGRIRNVLGGEQLFNIEDLIQRGGIAQGAQNPGASAPGIAGVLAQREKEREQQRGVGNVGVF